MQQYDPLGNWPLSTLMAALPVLVLLGLLASGKAGAWQAARSGGCSPPRRSRVGVFRMPVRLVAASAGVGMVFATFRIVWLIVAAVFLYDIAVATGQFEVKKASIARLSGEPSPPGGARRPCSFGAFIEGAAGFRLRRWRSRPRSSWVSDSTRSTPRCSA